MGKRSLERMTGLTKEERIERAIGRKAEEEKRKQEERTLAAKQLLEIIRANSRKRAEKNRWVSPEKLMMFPDFSLQ